MKLLKSGDLRIALRVMTVPILMSGLVLGVAIPASPSWHKFPSSTVSDDSVPEQDEALQTKVGTDYDAKSLSEILEDISNHSKVHLITSKSIGGQRFTIHSSPRKIHQLMRFIVCTLSHSIGSEPSYYWEREKEANLSSFVYVLKRNLRATRQEREARSVPASKMKVLITDFRSILNLPSNERSDYKTDLPRNLLDEKDPVFGIYHAAIRGLSDADIKTLFSGASVNLDPERLRDAVALSNQREQTAYQNLIARIINKRALPPPPKPLILRDNPKLRLTENTIGGDQPWKAFEYAVRLDGVFEDEWLTINPLDTPLSVDENEDETKSIIDLSPLLSTKGITSAQRNSLAYTLRAFSKAAKANICAEHFYKLDTLGVPILGLKPTDMKGTKTQVLKNICVNWGYSVTQKDGTYLLWSQSWVFDKAADIPDYSIERWRKIRRQRERFTSQEFISMAQSYTWLQVAVTLPLLLSESPGLSNEDEFPPAFLQPIYSRMAHQALRLQGLLSPSEQSRALSEEGVAINSLPSNTISEAIQFVLIGHEDDEISKQNELRQMVVAGRLRLKRVEGFRFERPLAVEVLRGE